MLNRLFGRKQQVSESTENAPEAPVSQHVEFIRRQGNYTQKEHLEQYKPSLSFVDRLPWVEFLDENKTLLLEDGRSVGAVFEITVIGTEGRSAEFLANARTQVCHAIQDSFPELDMSPWVVQFYCQDDEMSMEYEDILRNYVKPNAQGTQFTEQWLNIMGKHLRDVSKPGGLFEDKAVTGTQWRGQQRRTRMVIYRYVEKHITLDQALEDLNATCDSVTNALLGAGIRAQRLNGNAIHQWLLRWFNPVPEDYDNPEEFYKACHYTIKQNNNPDDLYLVNDFAETLLVNTPRTEGSYWYFDNCPHEVVVVDSLRRAPEVGHLTGEVKRGDNVNSLFDLLPENTIMVLTVVVYPQDLLENHIQSIKDSALGENTESIYAKKDCDRVKDILKDKHKMYRSSLAFYLRANTTDELRKRSRRLRTTLQSTGLVAVKEGMEIAPLSSYIRWLPMCFNPADDRHALYTKFNFVQHIANLLPVFGRGIGTRHPGITYFNRGGAPLDFDPLNKDDRAKSGHALILGPTGAGKSATLNGKIAQLMAIHRPRLFVIEAGNSFGLMSEYAERYGLTVNRVTLKPGGGVSLPLFADCHRLVADPELSKTQRELLKEIQGNHVEDSSSIETVDEEEGDDQRDILGEMEIAARLMITGGEVKEDEKLTRPDKAMIRKAILLAAQKTYSHGRTTLTQDIRDAFYELSQDESLPEARRTCAYEMGEAIGMFCLPGSFEAELFNREGEIWPDADITLVDLATLAREGYEAQLAIAYISLINHINSLGEKYQFSGRPIVNITDEAHIITVNAMLARFLTKAGKMWRKLGIWLWLATQNLKDFPGDASKLLSMLEWWELLCLEKDEVEQVGRFKQLTPEQIFLVTSVKKENRKYTEGVVLSSKMEALFRVVPPSLYLALAMTEPEEKAERATLMQKYGICELDAAIKVAENIDKARGITQ
ncbi:conjugative transfer ATPase [Glaesserella parasuis]|uniref:conjugative transfer ATPase n=1 Tax=Glaesserella parasuis TaxID=738 RepID=UPI00135DF2EA|nr:conjugative transfer ATPase [Glaesserella parasuis]MDG6240096.1 conjugative transfer ATPase [Glaesserella parasuis]MWQ06368.1 conjugative transfer ATPase [Glaesserella parasuis]MWQ81174.1 conjugative transfer ATPase [Glaesserella parasuis]